MGKVETRTSPNPLWNAVGCLTTGWALARWYGVVKLSPPKVHPFAAALHGALSSGINYSLGYAIDKGYKDRNTFRIWDRVAIAAFLTFASITTARVIVNHLNMNYLQLNKINSKRITLRPITMRDSFLMELVSRSFLLLR